MLIKRAKIITTITGTTGWEALLYEKPVINFGHAFYNSSGLVRNLSDITKLPVVVDELLNKFTFDTENLYKFIAAVLQTTHHGKIYEPLIDPETILSEKNIGLLTDALLNEMMQFSD